MRRVIVVYVLYLGCYILFTGFIHCPSVFHANNLFNAFCIAATFVFTLIQKDRIVKSPWFSLLVLLAIHLLGTFNCFVFEALLDR